jgi:hypothetical protein
MFRTLVKLVVNPSHRSQETLHFDGLPPYCCGGSIVFAGPVRSIDTSGLKSEQHHKKKLECRPLPLECMDSVSLEAFR